MTVIPRRYHRVSKAYPDKLVAALAAVLDEPPSTVADWVHWLQ